MALALVLQGCVRTDDSTAGSAPGKDRPPVAAAPAATPQPAPPPPPVAAAPTPPRTEVGVVAPSVNAGASERQALAVRKRDSLSAKKMAKPATPESASATAEASPALNADQVRTQQRDAYIASLAQGSYSFNPPSPIKVAHPITVALWVDPVKKAAELAAEMGKAFPESAARVESATTAWSPRMKATLTGVDFEITPVGSKDFDGIKDLSATARTEWGWTIVPTSPGTRQLHLVLAVVLPPELGLPRELPQINRDVEVEVTVWWVIDHYWEKYWQWMLGGLASAFAASLAWWWKNRQGKG